MKIEEGNKKSNSIRRQENFMATSINILGIQRLLWSVVRCCCPLNCRCVTTMKEWNKCYLSPSMISRNRDLLLTCITKFSRVSIWTNTGEAIYSIFTGTAVVASNTDTIIDVWKQTAQNFSATKETWLSENHSCQWRESAASSERETILKVTNSPLIMKRKRLNFFIYNRSDWLFSNLHNTISLPPHLSPRSIWKQQYRSLSALQNIVTKQPIELVRGLGTLSLTPPFFDWPGNDRLINIPEMKSSLTNYCSASATAGATDAVAATAAATDCLPCHYHYYPNPPEFCFIVQIRVTVL